MRLLLISFYIGAVVTLLAGGGVLQAGEDWTYWVGPHGTGATDDVGLPERWNLDGGENSNLLWSAKIGSRSTPTVMSGRIYLLTFFSSKENQPVAGEKLVCLEAASGKLLWERVLPSLSLHSAAHRSSEACVVCDPDSGNVFVYGSGGLLSCVNGTTGALVWEHSLSEEFGFALSAPRSSSPLVLETSVIIGSPAAGWGDETRTAFRWLALDRKNGTPVWSVEAGTLSNTDFATAPVLGVVDGELQMVCSTGDGSLQGVHPRTGELLWSCVLSSTGTAATPLIAGNRVYCGHSGRNPGSLATGAVVCLDPTQRGEISPSGVVWKKTGYSLGFSAPQLIDGRLYFVTDDARLVCLNPENGEQIGDSVRVGSEMRANLLSGDGKLYTVDLHGKGHILKPTPQGAEVLFRSQFPEGEKCFGSPIAVNGCVYLSTTAAIYCFGRSDHSRPPVNPVNGPRETHVALDEKPAHLQVVPVDLLLSPGTRQVFHARLYNSKGQYLRNPIPEELSYRLEGPGEINPTDGAYTISSTSTGPGIGKVSLSFDDLKGEARLRIVPKLNWSFDFNDGRIPSTWTGRTNRSVLVDWDLYEKLRQKDQLTARLYLFVQGACADGKGQCDLDDSTPGQHWTNFLKFLELEEEASRPQSIEEAKARFDAGLKMLVDERALERFHWSEWKRQTGGTDPAVSELRLSFTRSHRPPGGNGVLACLSMGPSEAPIPLWMGPSTLHDYTLQADVLGLTGKGTTSAAGIIIQRYPFRLAGEKLQLQSWSSEPQANSSVADTEKPDVWQTVKLKAENKDGKTTLSGKIWLRDAAEPKEWSLREEVDSSPSGSPGFVSGSGNGAVFIDNVTVTPNGE